MSSPQDPPTTSAGGATDEVQALDKLAEVTQLYDRYVRLARLTEIPALTGSDDASDLPIQDRPNTDRPSELLLLCPPTYSPPPLGLTLNIAGE